MEKNLEFLKRQLSIEVNNYQVKKDKLNKLKEKNCFYKEIEKIFDLKNFEEMKDNLVLLDISLQQVYGEDAAKISSVIHEIFINIKNYSSTNYYEKELKSELLKLEKVYNEIIAAKKTDNDELEFLYIEQKQNKKRIVEYKKILNNLKNNYVINSYQVKLIYEAMEKYDYSEKEQILIIESIINHNKKIRVEDYKYDQTLLSKILNKKFYYLDVEEYNLESLNNKIISIFSSLTSIEDYNEIYKYLPELETGLYTEAEYDYIYKSLLNKIIKEINDSQEELSKKETYKDYELSSLFISNFLSMEKLFNCIKAIYLSSKSKEDIEEIEEPEIIEKEAINNIFFATNNNTESYFEKDMKDIPEESLEEVRKKLENFKYDELRKNEIKSFYSNNKLSSYRELRGDQIRIIFKNMKGNNYVFVGLFLKKDDKDQRSYINCANRKINIDISTEENYLLEREKASETYDRIMNYIKEHKRKGNRY